MIAAASLFAGIGGFDVAAGRGTGIDVVLQAESDPSAQAVLRAHLSGVGVKLVDDATTVDLHGIDLVMAGFPCQGLSAAASTPRGRGLLDPTSPSAVVWAALQRIFAAAPQYVLLENADSLRTDRYVDDLRALQIALHRAGYHAHLLRLNAGCYGSQMRRVRTFILARREPWLAPAVESRIAWPCNEPAIGVANQQGGATWCTQPSVTKKAASYTLMVTPDEVLSLKPEAVEMLFGFPSAWTEAAGSTAQRYARLGNAVSVDAAEAALQALLGHRTNMRRPTYSYASLHAFARPAAGGAAGSAFGRIARTLRSSGARNPNFNRIELEYAAPVYIRWMEKHRDEVTPAMWEYLKRVRPHLPAPRPWPTAITVEMEQ